MALDADCISILDPAVRAALHAPNKRWIQSITYPFNNTDGTGMLSFALASTRLASFLCPDTPI